MFYKIPDHEFLEVNEFGDIRKVGKSYILKPQKDKDGYLAYSVSYKGKNYRVSQHRSVAKTFIPNPENKPQVNHIDSSRDNNHVSNLEWVTPEENQQHSWRQGKARKILGEDNHIASISNKQAITVCEHLVTGLSNVEISKLVGVSDRIIKDIRIKKSWSHISDKYSYPDKVRGKLSKDEVIAVCEALQSKLSMKKILSLGISEKLTYSDVKHIKYGHSYTHITKHYLENVQRPSRKGVPSSEGK